MSQKKKNIEDLFKDVRYHAAIKKLCSTFANDPVVQRDLKSALFTTVTGNAADTLLATEKDYEANKKWTARCIAYGRDHFDESPFYARMIDLIKNAAPDLDFMLEEYNKSTQKLFASIICACITGKYFGDEYLRQRVMVRHVVCFEVKNPITMTNLKLLMKYKATADAYTQSNSVYKESIIKQAIKERQGLGKDGTFWFLFKVLYPMLEKPVLAEIVYQMMRETLSVVDRTERKGASSGACTRLKNKLRPVIVHMKLDSVAESCAASDNPRAQLEHICRSLRDRINMQIALHIVPRLYQVQGDVPLMSVKQMMMEHRTLIPLYHRQLAENRVATREKRAAQVLLFSASLENLDTPNQFSTKDFDIIAPKTRQEIVDEGAAMHHCVAMYAERHGTEVRDNRFDYIMFVRRKDGSRFATIEVLYDTKAKYYEVRQCYKFADKADSETRYIAKTYAAFLNNEPYDVMDLETGEIIDSIVPTMRLFREQFIEKGRHKVEEINRANAKAAEENHSEGIAELDIYECLNQVLDNDDLCNEIHRATPEGISDLVDDAIEAYVW